VTRAARGALAAWLAGAIGCAAVIARTDFSTDLSAFLPRSPSPVQQVLVEQLREGVVSRLILIAVEGEPPDRLAQISRRLAASLRASASFASVNNGEEAGFEKDRDLVWRHRYLLSPAVKAERFSAQGLRVSLDELLLQLASPAGVLLQRVSASDPGGELMRLLQQFAPQARPRSHGGVWLSRDGGRALLVAQTRASAADIDAQKQALGTIHDSFAQAAAGAEARLLVTGPGVFSVTSRERIRQDAWRLSLIATALIAAMLLALYRSVRVLGLGLLPVASGTLAGIAAVSLAFGSVHGITLAFGVTLICEGVDYAIYLFTQNAPGAQPARQPRGRPRDSARPGRRCPGATAGPAPAPAAKPGSSSRGCRSTAAAGAPAGTRTRPRAGRAAECAAGVRLAPAPEPAERKPPPRSRRIRAAAGRAVSTA